MVVSEGSSSSLFLLFVTESSSGATGKQGKPLIKRENRGKERVTVFFLLNLCSCLECVNVSFDDDDVARQIELKERKACLSNQPESECQTHSLSNQRDQSSFLSPCFPFHSRIHFMSLIHDAHPIVFNGIGKEVEEFVCLFSNSSLVWVG